MGSRPNLKDISSFPSLTPETSATAAATSSGGAFAGASNKSLYAAMAADKQEYPTQEQAIVLDSIDGIPVAEYCYAIGSVIEPEKIKFVSRISQGRVCLYVDSGKTADYLCDTVRKVKVLACELTIRPLISKTRRIIISNVCPQISNVVLVEALEKHGIKPVSEINFIKASVTRPGFLHILSSRRQMSVAAVDVPKVPPSISITHNSTEYHIYLSTDELICYKCKEKGHLAKYCKSYDPTPQNITPVEKQTIPADDNQETTSDDPSKTKTNQFTAPAPVQDDEKFQPQMTTLPTGSAKKRQHSVSLASERNDTETASQKSGANPRKKKFKEVSSSEVAIYTEKIKSELAVVKKRIDEGSVALANDFDVISSFLIGSYHNRDLTGLAHDLNCDIVTVGNDLSILLGGEAEGYLKSRITSLKRRVEKKIAGALYDTDSSMYESDGQQNT